MLFYIQDALLLVSAAVVNLLHSLARLMLAWVPRVTVIEFAFNLETAVMTYSTFPVFHVSE